MGAVRFCFFVLAWSCLHGNLAEAIDLRSTTNEYDYIVIAHDSFATSLSGLLNHRQVATGLRPCLVLTSEIASEFGSGVNSATAIREFIRFSAEQWAITPSYVVLVGDANVGENPDSNLVPTFYDNESRPLESDLVRADDGRVLVRMGRIPCLTSQHLSNYLTKLFAHEAPGTRGDWERKALILFGDVDDYSIRDREHQVIGLAETHVPWLSTTSLYSRQYTTSTSAENATLAAWTSGTLGAAGRGLVFAFGYPWNTKHDLVQMANFDLSELPTFTQRLPANGHYSLVVAPTCHINRWFPARSYPWSVSEDLLFSRIDAGAIGVIAAGTDSYIEDNITLSELIFRTIGSHTGGLDSGRLLASVWRDFIDRPWVPTNLSYSYSLLGEPAAALHFPINTPSNWFTGFEVEDEMAIQNRLVSLGLGSTGVASKAVWVSVITPPEGDRCMQFTLTPAPNPTNLDFAEWEMARPQLTIEKNTYLLYRERVSSSPAGRGAVSLDGLTSTGTSLRSIASVKDQFGASLSAKTRGTASGGWRSIYVDLSPLEGQVLSTLTVRYEDFAVQDQGQLAYFVDDVHVLKTSTEDDALNGGFELSGPQTVPLGWEAIPGVPGEMGGIVSPAFPANGTNCMTVFDADCAGQGISQVATLSPLDGVYQFVGFGVRGFGTLRVRVRRGSTGWNVVEDVTIPVSSSWNNNGVFFENADAGNWSQYRIEFSTGDCNNVVFLDDVSISEPGVTAVGTESLNRRKVATVSLQHSSVARSVADLRLSIRPTDEGRVDVDIINVVGQRIGGWSGRLTVDHWSTLNGTDLGLSESAASGIYFISTWLDGHRGEVGKITILR